MLNDRILITCPNCGENIPLTETLAGPIIEETKRKILGEAEQREKILTTKLEASQKVEAELLKKSRELDDEKRELELTVQKRVAQEQENLRAKAKQEIDEQYRLKISEMELENKSFKNKVNELQQKLEQKSQQLQGEVLELELEGKLRECFKFDEISPVPKGEFGGDVLQHVAGGAGTIIWETKRTKTWSDGWLAKLRTDQRAAKAEIAVLVSFALPKEIKSFDAIDGVWVVSPDVVVPVATMLRQSLVEIRAARQISAGAKTKADSMYEYLTGTNFKQRVSAIVEAFESMRDDLNAEKKAILKQWGKREQQINRVMESTVGMYGDMQGIASGGLIEIEGLEFKALSEGD